MRKTNLTLPTGLVLHAISLGIRHGFDIMAATGLPSGTIYPALRRLEGAGCLTSQWEEPGGAESEGRPPRCYYTLTGAGESLRARAVKRFPAIRLAVNSSSGTPAIEGGSRDTPEGRGKAGDDGNPTPQPGRA
jgi:DNA-binding PadR family transcriptional regulator